MQNRIFYTLVFTFIVTFSSPSQQLSLSPSLAGAFEQGTGYFAKQKYVAARKCFQEVLDDKSNENSIYKSQAAYYVLMCAIELGNDDAEQLAENFFASYPDNPNTNRVLFRLANYESYKKKYKQSVYYFSRIDKAELNDDEKAEYNFKYGYSWFLQDSLEKARKLFYEIKDIDTKYTAPAIYYYSHIAYIQKNYETAINGFVRLKDDETFASIIPYYISQCYYLQEKWDDVISYASPLLDSVIDSRVAEMARMIADAYYHKAKYTDAVTYYEKYFDKGKDFKPQDYYQAGYSYYVTKQYDNAISYLEKASEGDSQIAQNASYHLGDCYIHANEKNKAMMAFNVASKMKYDAAIEEDALFNYAVLSFELSNSPFNSSVKALNDYISRYPESRRSDEAYNYLMSSYLNTQNYQNAIDFIEKIKVKDKSIKKAYQRALFFRGIELYNNLQFDEAQKKFEQSNRMAEYDALIASRTNYWLGELAYRNNDVDKSLDFYNLFQQTEISSKTPEYITSFYNIAYCYFNQKDYTIASDWFVKFLEQNKKAKNKLTADAYNRIADCWFMETRYKDAIENYNKSIEMGLADKDYATFQKAFCLGLLGKHKDKIALLGQLMKESPQSLYMDNAMFETGRSYLMMQNSEKAIDWFDKILTEYPSGSFAKKALLQKGLIQYNDGKNTLALETYKKVVADYPETQEAKSALNGIRNIYIELNEVDTYLSYTESLGNFANVTVSEQDSLLYYAGENVYTAGDFNKARDNFKKYLEKFPEGSFSLNAKYYFADCSLRAKDTIKALEMYKSVIAMPVNSFSEMALAIAGELNMKQKNYNDAYSQFIKLDSIAEENENIINARVGAMKAAYFKEDYIQSVSGAQKVLKTQGISQEAERKARYILAKSFLAVNQPKDAFDQMKKLASDVKNVEGAEAKYRMAEYYFTQGQQQKAEKEIFNFIDLNTPHQYWMAKAYILLSDIYHNKKNDFQAANTLQSIIDNYDNQTDGIINEALEKKKVYDAKPSGTTTKEDDINIKIK